MKSTRKIRIDGVQYTLCQGVQVWKRRGKSRLVAYNTLADGTVQTQSFPMSAEGVKAANAAVGQASSEVEMYGSSFGTLSFEERHVIERVRAYQKECIGQGVRPVSVSDIIEEGLRKARAVTSNAPLYADVMQEYLATLLEAEVTESHYERQSGMARNICNAWPQKRINGITAADVEEFMKTVHGRGGAKPSPWTLSAYQNLVSAAFTFAVRRNYIRDDENPMKNVAPVKTGTLKEPEVLTTQQAKEVLMLCATTPSWVDVLPSLVLGLLCGIRAAERARLRWSDIRPGGRDEIYLCRAITKTNYARVVPISPALSEWLDYFTGLGMPTGSDEFIVKTANDTEKSRIYRQEAFIYFAKKRGLKMPKNVLRHTAASNLSVTQGRFATSDMLGHDERMLVKHYRRAMTKEDAEELLNITPRTLGLVKAPDCGVPFPNESPAA